MKNWINYTRLIAIILILIISLGSAWIFIPASQGGDLYVTQQGQYTLFLILMLLSLLVASLFLSESIRTVCLVSVATVFLAAYAANLFWIIRIHERTVIRPSKLEVLQNLQRSGVNAVPYTLTSVHDLSRARAVVSTAVSDETIVYCKEGGDWAVYQSDEYGFNNPKGNMGQAGRYSSFR